MKHQTGYTLTGLLIVLWISCMTISISTWMWNATKLASCDFDAPYKCELIHGVGLVLPPLAIVTVWFDID